MPALREETGLLIPAFNPPVRGSNPRGPTSRNPIDAAPINRTPEPSRSAQHSLRVLWLWSNVVPSLPRNGGGRRRTSRSAWPRPRLAPHPRGVPRPGAQARRDRPHFSLSPPTNLPGRSVPRARRVPLANHQLHRLQAVGTERLSASSRSHLTTSTARTASVLFGAVEVCRLLSSGSDCAGLGRSHGNDAL